MATNKFGRTVVTNPFYDRVIQEGIGVIGDPARTAGRTRVTNPYFDSARKKVKIHRHQGRPRKGTAPIGPTEVKSIRLPREVWEQVDEQARREKKTRHAAMREAVLIWLKS